MERLLFDVKKVPTTGLLKDDSKTTSAISHAIVGKGTVLHFCSEGYGLMPNAQIYGEFKKHFEENGINFSAYGTNFGDTRFQMDFAILDHPISIGGDNDVLYPSIRVLNSYNGYQRYSFQVRILREICTNGLTALVDAEELKMLHTPQVEDGAAVLKSLTLLENFMELYEDATEPFLELQDFKVRDVPTRILEVSEAIKFPVGLTQHAIDRAEKEMREFKVAPTDWLVYNALNYQLNHNADNLVGRKASVLDKNVLDYLLTY